MEEKLGLQYVSQVYQSNSFFTSILDTSQSTSALLLSVQIITLSTSAKNKLKRSTSQSLTKTKTISSQR